MEWALISKKKPRRVLRWFGTKKPSKDRVYEEEKRIQFFKYSEEGFSLSKRVDEESFSLSKRDGLLIKEADPSKKTAESLYKIIQFLLYRVPQKRKSRYFSRLTGKIRRISPTQIGLKKMPPTASIGQAISMSKNLLSGLNPLFVSNVLQELIRLLSMGPNVPL
jgi:hypothetical protein